MLLGFSVLWHLLIPDSLGDLSKSAPLTKSVQGGARGHIQRKVKEAITVSCFSPKNFHSKCCPPPPPRLSKACEYNEMKVQVPVEHITNITWFLELFLHVNARHSWRCTVKWIWRSGSCWRISIFHLCFPVSLPGINVCAGGGVGVDWALPVAWS